MLQRHELCSDAIHQVLDLVENEMLVVLSAKTRRSSSRKLRAGFDLNRERSFYVVGRPRDMGAVRTIAVEAHLRSFWREREIAGSLPTYDGVPQGSLTEEQLKDL